MGQEIDSTKLVAVVTELVGVIDRIYGLYLDSTNGFKLNLEQTAKGQEYALQALKQTEPQNASLDYLDSFEVYYGIGDPNDPANRIQHRTTQGELKRRNSPGGLNDKLISQFFITLVTVYWEHEYRNRIAEALKIEGEFQFNIAGDFRLLRNDIVHNKGILRAETARKLKRISSPADNSELYISPENMEQVVWAWKADLDDLVKEHTEFDPQFRTIWHVK